MIKMHSRWVLDAVERWAAGCYMLREGQRDVAADYFDDEVSHG